MSSHCFHPSVGGLETVSQILAEEFAGLGVDLKVITQTPSAEADRWPFEIIRQPSPRHLWQLVQWCDVFFHNNISLQKAWPLLFLRRPWVVAHHIWIARSSGRVSWQDRLKRWALPAATSLSISKAIAADLPVNSTVVGNPYRDSEFGLRPGIPRNRELIFVGRLVSAKGVSLLIEALGAMQREGQKPQLTIVGSGPEEEALKALVASLGLLPQVRFAGVLRGEALVEVLNAHRIMVIPSLWAEPFGIVALEAIACGCAIVGSALGGLPEAIGPCGVTFPNGDVTALCQALTGLLDDPAALDRYCAAGASHLERFKPRAVAEAYLSVLESAARRADKK